MTASGGAPLATTSGVATVQLGFCYQSPGGALINFVGSNFSIVQIGTQRTANSVSATVSGLPAGTYTVGMCLQPQATTPAIPNNDFVNAWVMVHN